MRRHRHLLPLLLLVTIAGASAPAIVASGQQPPAAGGVAIRLLEAPEARRDDPRAKIYVVDHLRPGDTISRRLGVRNDTGEALAVELYAGAARIGDSGFVPDDGRAVNDLTTWTKVEPGRLTLRPGTETPVRAVIAVPRNASAGERYGVVWVEIPSASSTGVRVVNRVGIRVYLSVGPGGEPASDFAIESLTAKRRRDGTPIVTGRVRNTGGRALDMSGKLGLANGPAGLAAGPFDAKLGTTLGIGRSGPVEVALDKRLPAGPWDAELTLRSGTTERSAKATITFPEPGDSSGAVPAEQEDGERTLTEKALVPLSLVGLVMVSIVGASQVVRRRRRAG